MGSSRKQIVSARFLHDDFWARAPSLSVLSLSVLPHGDYAAASGARVVGGGVPIHPLDNRPEDSLRDHPHNSSHHAAKICLDTQPVYPRPRSQDSPTNDHTTKWVNWARYKQHGVHLKVRAPPCRPLAPENSPCPRHASITSLS